MPKLVKSKPQQQPLKTTIKAKQNKITSSASKETKHSPRKQSVVSPKASGSKLSSKATSRAKAPVVAKNSSAKSKSVVARVQTPKKSKTLQAIKVDLSSKANTRSKNSVESKRPAVKNPSKLQVAKRVLTNTKKVRKSSVSVNSKKVSAGKIKTSESKAKTVRTSARSGLLAQKIVKSAVKAKPTKASANAPKSIKKLQSASSRPAVKSTVVKGKPVAPTTPIKVKASGKEQKTPSKLIAKSGRSKSSATIKSVSSQSQSGLPSKQILSRPKLKDSSKDVKTQKQLSAPKKSNASTNTKRIVPSKVTKVAKSTTTSSASAVPAISKSSRTKPASHLAVKKTPEKLGKTINVISRSKPPGKQVAPAATKSKSAKKSESPAKSKFDSRKPENQAKSSPSKKTIAKVIEPASTEKIPSKSSKSKTIKKVSTQPKVEPELDVKEKTTTKNKASTKPSQTPAIQSKVTTGLSKLQVNEGDKPAKKTKIAKSTGKLEPVMLKGRKKKAEAADSDLSLEEDADSIDLINPEDDLMLNSEFGFGEIGAKRRPGRPRKNAGKSLNLLLPGSPVPLIPIINLKPRKEIKVSDTLPGEGLAQLIVTGHASPAVSDKTTSLSDKVNSADQRRDNIDKSYMQQSPSMPSYARRSWFTKPGERLIVKGAELVKEAYANELHAERSGAHTEEEVRSIIWSIREAFSKKKPAPNKRDSSKPSA